MSPEPKYRIIYSDGVAGHTWSWSYTLAIIARRRQYTLQPIRVERVR
jgi:hypothetical protein